MVFWLSYREGGVETRFVAINLDQFENFQSPDTYYYMKEYLTLAALSLLSFSICSFTFCLKDIKESITSVCEISYMYKLNI